MRDKDSSGLILVILLLGKRHSKDERQILIDLVIVLLTKRQTKDERQGC